jgi:hypothetical protein
VGGVDTGVNNVGASTSTGGVGVGVGGGALLGVGETGQTPGSVALGGEHVEDGLLLNVLDLRVICQYVPIVTKQRP